jgi:hypothetical protein
MAAARLASQTTVKTHQGKNTRNPRRNADVTTGAVLFISRGHLYRQACGKALT